MGDALKDLQQLTTKIPADTSAGKVLRAAIAELEALRKWMEYVRFNTKEAAYMADEAMEREGSDG